jgi:hypothetical protein
MVEGDAGSRMTPHSPAEANGGRSRHRLAWQRLPPRWRRLSRSVEAALPAARALVPALMFRKQTHKNFT